MVVEKTNRILIAIILVLLDDVFGLSSEAWIYGLAGGCTCNEHVRMLSFRNEV